jgi:DNA repair exonuclease SbcCD ATPase subunit
MLNLKRLKNTVSSVLLLSMITSSAFSQTPIPDEIDFKKYETLYLQAKQASDAKRIAADKALGDLQTAQTNLNVIDGRLLEQRQAISETQSAIATLQQENFNLQGQNQALSNELNRHQSDLSGAKLLADREGNRVRTLQAQLNQEQQTFANLQAIYQRELQAYQNLQNRLAQTVNERDQAVQALNVLRSRIAQTQSQLQAAQNDLTRSTQRIRELESSISSIQPQLNSVQSELSGVEQELRTQEAKLQSYYDRERATKVALDASRSSLATAQGKVDQANSALQSNRAEQAQLESAISSLERSIQENQNELSNLQGSISTAKNNLTNAENENRAIDQKMPGLVSRIVELRTLQGELTVQMERKKFELEQIRAANPSDPRIPGLESEIQDLTNRRNAAGQERLALDGEKKGLDSRKTELTGQISSLRSQISSLESKAQSLPGTIASQQSQLSSNRSRLSTLNSQESQLASNLEAARAQVGSLQSEVARNESAYNSAVRERQVAEAPLEPLRSRQRELASRRDQLSRQLSQAQNELNSQKTVAQNARAQVQQLGVDIAAFQNALPGLENTVAIKSRAVETLTSAVQDSYRRTIQAQQSADQQSGVVNAIAGTLARSEAQLNVYLNDISRLSALITQKQQTIVANESRIRENTNTSIAYQNALPEMQRVEAQLVQARQSTAAQIVTLENTYAQLDQTAKILENETARRLAIYQERRAKYDQLLAAAQAAGSEQGNRLGSADGAPKGEADGSKEGKDKGSKKGTEEGLLYGLNEGKTQGDAKGFIDGREKGLSSATDYQQGYALGIEQGKRTASEEANRIDYPKGKSDRKSVLLSQVPPRAVVIDNNAVAARPTVLGFVSANRYSENAFALGSTMAKAERASEAGNEMEIVFPLDSQSDRMVLAVLARPVPQCNQSYIDFKKACAAAFEGAYDAAFKDAYADNYSRAYQIAFDSSYQVAFDKNKSVRFQEGYQLGYASGTARGLEAGKQEAQNKGLADGQKEGYSSSIAGYKAEAYQRGVKEIDDFFANNAIVEIREASFGKLAGGSAGPIVIVGDRLTLQLKGANIGAKDSTRPQIKVEAEALTPNLAVENKVVQLAGIPSQTSATIQNVLNVKVLPGAAGGSQEKVKIRWNNSEGEMQEKVVTIVVAAAVTGRVNEIEFDAKPRVGKTKDVKVSITNTSKVNPVLPVQVQLVTAEPAANLVINAKAVKVTSFNAGSSWIIPGLQFTAMNKDALSRGMKMTVRLIHGSTIIAQKEILIQR